MINLWLGVWIKEQVFSVVKKKILPNLYLKAIEPFKYKNNSASIALLKKHNFVFESEKRGSF